MNRITSLKNPTVQLWREWVNDRKQREKEGVFPAEGEHMVQEALSCSCVKTLIVSEDDADRYAKCIEAANPNDVFIVSGHILSSLNSTKSPQGIMAFCHRRIHRPFLPHPGLFVALNAVQDPGNVGTILRTMDAAGFEALYIDDQCADPYSAKTIRATMGSIFRIPIIQSHDLVSDLKAMKDRGCQLIAGDLSGEDLFSRTPIPEQACILIGNEGRGLSEDLKVLANMRVRIPMPGSAESLNAAVSAGILIYDLLRERMKG